MAIFQLGLEIGFVQCLMLDCISMILQWPWIYFFYKKKKMQWVPLPRCSSGYDDLLTYWDSESIKKREKIANGHFPMDGFGSLAHWLYALKNIVWLCTTKREINMIRHGKQPAQNMCLGNAVSLLLSVFWNTPISRRAFSSTCMIHGFCYVREEY